MAKISDAQFGALDTLIQFGPVKAIEVAGPKSMDGSRKIKLECHAMSPATLANFEANGYVTVTRTPIATPVNAVGKKGNARRALVITITEAGRAAFAKEMAA
jgi:hypothetical protein